MALLKIKGATPLDPSTSICVRCRSAQIVKGSRNEEEIYCAWGYNGRNPVRMKVVECSGFEDKTLPSISAYEDLAFVWCSHPTTGEMKFIRLSDLNALEQNKKMGF